jgi:quercetin dioxygenase-like cupin family protein
VLRLNPTRIVVPIYEIAAGATLREHKHPFVRYASGTLLVTNTEIGRSQVYRTGEFIIEAIGQWHLDDRPLKLLVIDQKAGQKSNVVMRK